MRAFVRVVAGLCLLWTALAGSLVGLGHQQPDPALLAMLRLTDCAPPCWAGIMPGHTTLAEARHQLIRVFGTAGYEITFDLIGVPGQIWANVTSASHPIGILPVTIIAASGDVVDTIKLDLEPLFVRERISLADVHNVLGPPEQVLLPIYRRVPANHPTTLAWLMGSKRAAYW